MEPKEAFSIVIRKYRKAASVTQEELALDCDLDRTYISMLERGINQPSLTTLLLIASRLNVRASQMIKDVEDLIQKQSK